MANKTQGSVDGTGSALLERLEQLVQAATTEINSLRESNQALETKVEELVQKNDEGQGTLSAWSAKQDEIESRLEGLVGGLEKLLSD